jgi:hypothetical protein
MRLEVDGKNRWCREGESNPQGTKYRRILSPLRLPVPPSRHLVEVLDFVYDCVPFSSKNDECATV